MMYLYAYELNQWLIGIYTSDTNYKMETNLLSVFFIQDKGDDP